MESKAAPCDSSTSTLEFVGPYKAGVVVDVELDVVVVDVEVVELGLVVEVMEVVVVDVVVVEGIDTKYAATPAMIRMTTTIATIAAVLIAVRRSIFILEHKNSSKLLSMKSHSHLWDVSRPDISSLG